MNWKSFKEYIPYLSGLIILLGLIRQMVYYQHYNIEIQNYIGVSELFLAWLNESILFIAVVIMLLLGMKSFLYSESNLRQAFKVRILKTISKVSIGSLAMYILLFAFDISFALETFCFVLFIWCFYAFIVIRFESYLFTQLTKLRIFQFIFFSLLFIFLIYRLTNQSIKNVDKGNYVGTTIYTKDSTYVSDKTHYYIGKTDKFYFVYDKIKKSTLVIPEKEVLKFDLKGGIPLYNLKSMVLNDSSIFFKP